MSSNNLNEGHAVQILSLTPEQKFHLDENALSSVLLQDKVKNRPVVVLSIAGDFRKGKSFMLNHFLRLFQVDDKNLKNKAKIVFSENNMNQPLSNCFNWRGGREPDTSGILMWSKPFIVQTKEGEVAVLLMDTQGSFDSKSSLQNIAYIFALSALTSSVIIYNLMFNLQEDNLNNIDIFSACGNYAKKYCNESNLETNIEKQNAKPFQHLVFLIRDWQNPESYSCDFEGGTKLLEETLEQTEQMPEQMKNVRKRIDKNYEKIECFLMPYPGENIANFCNFDGRFKDYKKSFFNSLKEFVTKICVSDRFQVKRISGLPLTGNDLFKYFKEYAKIFENNDSMPQLETLYDATAALTNQKAIDEVLKYYQAELKNFFDKNTSYMKQDKFDTEMTELKNNCLTKFDKIPKMCNESFSVSYRKTLLDNMNKLLDPYVELNLSREGFFDKFMKQVLKH